MWSKMYSGLHIQYTLFLSDFNETWILLTNIRKILRHQIARKFVRVPCGETDMTKLIVAFRNFANAPKKSLNWIVNSHKAPCISVIKIYRSFCSTLRGVYSSHLTTPTNKIWGIMQSFLKLSGCNFTRTQYILSKLPVSVICLGGLSFCTDCQLV